MSLGRLAHFGMKYAPLEEWQFRMSQELDTRREDHLLEISCKKDDPNGEVINRDLGGIPLKLVMSDATNSIGDKCITVGLDCNTGNTVHEYGVKMAAVLNLFNVRKGEYWPIWAFYHNISNDSPLEDVRVYIKQSHLKSFIDDRGIIRATARIYIHSTKGLRKTDIPNFDVASEDSDIVFLVGNKRIHASRAYLSMVSPYFKAMFSGNFDEGTKKEITLSDIDPQEFKIFLYACYPSFTRPNDDTVESLLRFGDMYQVNFVTKNCEEFLMKSTTISNAKLLQLSDQYRLIGLQAKIWETLTSTVDIKRLMECRESAEFSVELKLALFDLLVEKTDG